MKFDKIEVLITTESASTEQKVHLKQSQARFLPARTKCRNMKVLHGERGKCERFCAGNARQGTSAAAWWRGRAPKNSAPDGSVGVGDYYCGLLLLLLHHRLRLLHHRLLLVKDKGVGGRHDLHHLHVLLLVLGTP